MEANPNKIKTLKTSVDLIFILGRVVKLFEISLLVNYVKKGQPSRVSV
jgi:hypothetical protein